MLEKNCLENVSQGKAFLKTKEGLLGVNPHDCVVLDRILDDINALLATKIWTLSDGTTPAEKIETEEEKENTKTEEKENTETEEVVETKEEKIETEEEKENTETEEENKVEQPKKKSMAPKCAKKINKPALD